MELFSILTYEPLHFFFNFNFKRERLCEVCVEACVGRVWAV